MPPHNQRKDNSKFKNKKKNNQNCQKIELYGSLTTKELRKKHASRAVGGEETGSQGGEDPWQGSDWQTRWFHIGVQISQEEQLGSETDHTTQGSSGGKESLKTSVCKTCGDCYRERKSQPHRRVHWRDPQGPRTYTNPPT